jgi:TetR/AcrR family transcriptional regulator
MAEARRKAQSKTRIQAINEDIILDAALAVFSTYGFRGTTVDQIAAKAGMSKPNLLYYFRRKEDMYLALLRKILADWLTPLMQLDPKGEPLEEIANYIRAKMKLARDNPEASRLFANEMLHGAPAIGDFLSGPLKACVEDSAVVLRGWMKEGRLATVDPCHLIFTIWAVTQHYADFDVQVRAVLGSKGEHFADAEKTVLTLILEGLKPR